MATDPSTVRELPVNYFSELTYKKELIAHYQALCHLPGFVLLESADRDRGRYDILSAFPSKQISLSPEDNSLEKTLLEVKALLPCKSRSSSLPFHGGLIGYISYDVGPRMANIVSPSHPDLKNMPLLQLNYYDWAIVVDHALKKIFLIAAHKDSHTSQHIEKVLDCWHRPDTQTLYFKQTSAFEPEISAGDYEAAFNTIHHDLMRGRAYQVNYTQAFKAAYQGSNWQLYKEIRQRNPVPYAAYIKGDAFDILSFSPERFLSHEKNKLLTSPIKGSAPRGNTPEQDRNWKHFLENSVKNRAENTMIVDLLRNDLGKIAKPGTVSVPGLCVIESYRGVHHLVSHIEAECNNNMHPIDMFMSCFPGGSITGAPKREAMQIISEHEPWRRGVYCGAIGYFSRHGRFDTNIAIRTITATSTHLHLNAGGGIVIDSKWEEEYAECFTKISAIINRP